MKPTFYSKQAIGILTLLLTPFLGTILFAYNLKEVGKGKAAPIIIAIGMVWTYLFKRLTADFLGEGLFQLLLSNAIGSAILTFMLWDTYFLNYPLYYKKECMEARVAIPWYLHRIDTVSSFCI